jgi:putative membrane protein
LACTAVAPGVQNAVVPLLAEIAAAVAALVHVWFFALESVLFTRPTVWRRFGVRSAEDAAVIRPMAFNQGFYNLFLAVGVVLGLLLVAAGNPIAGRAVVVFACASMVAAGAVLVATDRRFAGAAAIQAVPPLIALLATLLR